MFDISWSELVVIAVVALIVIGPKDLPRVMRSLGQMMRKIRQMSWEFRSGLDDFIRESELDEVRKSIHHVSNFDPKRRLDESTDPTAFVPPDQSTTAQPELVPDPPPAEDSAPAGKGPAA